jgi:hypothetical protein
LRGASAVVLLAIAAAAVATTPASAHRRDEFLQAARLAVEPNRVNLELDLTPGIAVADAIVSDIDRDHDGILSPSEERGYVTRVLSAIELSVDGRALNLDATASAFPGIDALRSGEGTIRIESAVVLPRAAPGAHQLFFRNAFRRTTSVYLANALVPRSAAVTITAQRRDVEQRDLTIDYDVAPARGEIIPMGLLGALAGAVLLTGLTVRANRGARGRRTPDPPGALRAQASALE